MGKGFRQTLKNALGAIYRDVGNEFAFAVDDIRQKVVEEPWFGRHTTPEAVDFYRWLRHVPDQGQVSDGRDPLGRSGKRADIDTRLERLDERVAAVEAHARHREAEPRQGALDRQWENFESWLAKEEARDERQGQGLTDDRTKRRKDADLEEVVMQKNDGPDSGRGLEEIAGMELEMDGAGVDTLGIGE